MFLAHCMANGGIVTATGVCERDNIPPQDCAQFLFACCNVLREFDFGGRCQVRVRHGVRAELDTAIRPETNLVGTQQLVGSRTIFWRRKYPLPDLRGHNVNSSSKT